MLTSLVVLQALQLRYRVQFFVANCSPCSQTPRADYPAPSPASAPQPTLHVFVASPMSQIKSGYSSTVFSAETVPRSSTASYCSAPYSNALPSAADVSKPLHALLVSSRWEVRHRRHSNGGCPLLSVDARYSRSHANRTCTWTASP